MMGKKMRRETDEAWRHLPMAAVMAEAGLEEADNYVDRC